MRKYILIVLLGLISTHILSQNIDFFLFGNIGTNTTIPNNLSIILINNVTIDENVILTLGSGSRLNLAGHTLTVNGRLEFNGSESAPIVVESDGGNTPIIVNRLSYGISASYTDFLFTGVSTGIIASHVACDFSHCKTNTDCYTFLDATECAVSISDSEMGAELLTSGGQFDIRTSKFTTAGQCDKNQINAEGTILEISQTAFKNSYSAPALKLQSSQLNLINTEFSNCNALFGAAIYADDSNIEATGTNFSDCSVGSVPPGDNMYIVSAGAVAVKASNLTLSNCKFTNNSCIQNGSALNTEGGELQITDCVFSRNVANPPTGYNLYDGGTVFLSNTKCIIQGTTFSDNYVAKAGGAISAVNCSIDNLISNCIFSYNNADFFGGAILFSQSKFNVENCKFQTNFTSNSGGAVFSSASEIQFVNNKFIENVAAQGGALSIEKSASIANNLFLRNSASVKGGACYFFSNDYDSDLAIPVYHNLFYGNKADIASAIYSETANIKAINSIFWANSSPDGLNCKVFSGKILPYFEGNIVENGLLSLKIYPELPSKNTVVKLFSEEPQFTDVAQDNFNLLPNSLAINAGNRVFDNMPSFDLNGNSRFYEGTFADIGPYESNNAIALVDSLALVDLYNSTNGKYWEYNKGWLTAPLEDWSGIAVISGKVQYLFLDYNNLEGEIPETISNLNALRSFSVAHNKLTKIPQSLGQMSSLISVDVSFNSLYDIPDYANNTFVQMNYFAVNDNYLTFKALIPNAGISYFTYQPQADIQDGNDIQLKYGSSFEYTSKILDNEPILTKGYWSKDGDQVSPDSKLTITNANSDNTGSYVFKINNEELPLLEISTTPIMIQVQDQPVLESDSLALVEFYNNTNGPAWVNNNGWLTNPISQWEGLFILNGRVIQIWLPKNKLMGEIGDAINKLDQLEVLRIDNNQLTGTIPIDFERLTNLTYLNLSHNYFTGELSTDILKNKNMTSIDLSSNSLEGQIPVDIWSLQELANLNLSFNKFTGVLPPKKTGDKLKFASLLLSNNQFSGQIDIDFSYFPKIYEFDLSKNLFTGKFPQGVTNMENLLSINLHDNYFDDTFPSEMLENPELITLNLSSNFIRGPLTFPTIPSKLEYLGLSDNELTGNLPEEIGSISTLKYLYISRNKFSGMVPSSLTLLDGLIEVNCGFNQFEGSLPDNFRSANLQYLDFDSNKFTGSIPQSYGSLRKLKTLKLYSNKLTGTLPKELGDLTLLENLELNANLLTGTIPEELSKLRSLKLLSLRTNKFYGNIPDSLSKLALLEKFYIYDNYFTSMPDFSQLTNMEAMQVLNNKFEFDQLEKNMSVCSDFQYLPMRDSTLILNLDNSEPLSIGYIPKGTANSYKWFFMNEEQVGKTAPTIYKENVFTADLGIYTLEVRNAKVPGLVLKYHFDVRKTPLIPIVTIPKPYCVGNSLVYLETASNGGDTYWYWDKALTELIGEGNKIMIQLTQNQDTLYVVNRIANSTSESVEIPLYIRPDVRFDSGVLTAVATDGVKYQWFENGVEIGTGPSITVGDGLYWLSVSKDGCVASSETINILHGVLGTDEYTSASSVKLFPNPARESVAIEWKSSYSGKVVLHIYDQSGRLVKTEGFNKQQPQANCQIDVSRLAHGNYQVKINEGKSQTTRKLIKL